MKILIIILSLAIISPNSNAHGYIEYPGSRAFFCSKQGGAKNSNCGAIIYEPQSIEGLKGFPEKGPSDGKIASANIPAFSKLDEQTETRWYRVNMNTGDNEFFWWLTARHKTSRWEFFITKKGWNQNKSLTRNQFEDKPFCEKIDNGLVPKKQKVAINCQIPSTYYGYHIILGIWTIDDTENAFYQVIDVDINNQSENKKNNQYMTDFHRENISLSEDKLYPKWEKDAYYDKGDRVIYKGKKYYAFSTHKSQHQWTPDLSPNFWTLDAKFSNRVNEIGQAHQ